MPASILYVPIKVTEKSVRVEVIEESLLGRYVYNLEAKLEHYKMTQSSSLTSSLTSLK